MKQFSNAKIISSFELNEPHQVATVTNGCILLVNKEFEFRVCKDSVLAGLIQRNRLIGNKIAVTYLSSSIYHIEVLD